MDLTPRIIYKNYVFSDNPNHYGNSVAQQQQQQQQQPQFPINVSYLPFPNVPIIAYGNSPAAGPAMTPSSSSSSSTTTTSNNAPGVYSNYYQPTISAASSPPYQFQANILQTKFYDTQQIHNNNNINSNISRVSSNPNFKLPPISSIMGSNNNNANNNKNELVAGTPTNDRVVTGHTLENTRSSYSSSNSSPITPRSNMMVMMGNPLMVPNMVTPIYQDMSGTTTVTAATTVPPSTGSLTPPVLVSRSPVSSNNNNVPSKIDSDAIISTTTTKIVSKINDSKPERKSRRKKFVCDGIGKHLSPEIRQKKQCPVCGKKCSRPSTLKTHYLIHTGDNPFCCTRPGCTKSFNVKSNLQRHIRSHDRKLSKTMVQPAQIPMQLPHQPLY
ncbi:similar to Saccharomyces cerevisiae YPR015C Putative protein of unknown function [Maudiozyma saulgeensis]|uniref:C2H2-type domain-containing protein n=1 Tax=Maudiozyma saulgeensis TaxID=1789683 RepID=A0A1X7R071_9SACH|nr:similar to Saccharomyces cerevisiae YPR015C Putative protein of unknown function [Kazachstania saulgeensis]